MPGLDALRALRPPCDSTLHGVVFAILLSALRHIPQRHESTPGADGVDVLAALVPAVSARLQNAPARARFRDALGFDAGGKADSIAGQHRADPAQVANARRRS